MAPKKLSVVTETDPETIKVFDKALGGLALLLFIIVWLLSALSPILFVVALHQGAHISAGVIALVTMFAYLPWEKGSIATALQKFYCRYSPQYMRKTTIVFEGGDDQPSAKPDAQQTFYAIHPHGKDLAFVHVNPHNAFSLQRENNIRQLTIYIHFFLNNKGTFCIGWAFLYVHDVMQHVRFCFSPALFVSPFFRLFSRGCGNPGSASKAAMKQYMTNGESLALPPGGFEEATLTCLTQDRVYLKKRTGFVKLCLQHGIAIRPVYVFGEKSCYWNMQGAFPSRLALNRYGIPTILSWGNTVIPLLPKPNVQLHIVVGTPLVLPTIKQPTKEEVAKWHNKYIAALTQLFEDHKEEAYGPESKTMKLEIW
jgi:1-acyl-sn-glycerol-3-phosphate acyltransferase